MNLVELLSGTEGKTLEFKRDLSSPNGIIKTIVAFANTAGGIIVIGVDDSKHILGLAQPLAMEEKLSSLIVDSIGPPLVPSIEIMPWRKTNVLVVEVYPSNSLPHYVKSQGPDKGVYVRVGSSNRQADLCTIQELRRLSLNQSFDEQPLPQLTPKDIDFAGAAQLFAPTRILKASDLKTIRLVINHQGRAVPTVAGILLFGRNRRDLFPDAWIQIGVFDGTDKSKILDTKEVTSYLVNSLEESIEYLNRYNSREFLISGGRRSERRTFPPVAIREALTNAVVHADYSQTGSPIRVSLFSDRVEIENPGSLLQGLTIPEIQQGVSKLRNRVIGRVFSELGLIEQWGSGIQRMTSACLEAGLPVPHFEEIGTHFRVTLWFKQLKYPDLDDVDSQVIKLLKAAGEMSTNELSKRLGLSARAVRQRLRRLVQMGQVFEIAANLKDPRKVYRTY